jgi:hypothetical protein
VNEATFYRAQAALDGRVNVNKATLEGAFVDELALLPTPGSMRLVKGSHLPRLGAAAGGSERPDDGAGAPRQADPAEARPLDEAFLYSDRRRPASHRYSLSNHSAPRYAVMTGGPTEAGHYVPLSLCVSVVRFSEERSTLTTRRPGR